MSEQDAKATLQAASDWWKTEIIDIRPGEITVRGYEIQDLIGKVSFPEMIWLMTRGDLPTAEQGRLLEAALVASVDHGPHAPSIAIASMAATCGIGLNNAMASAINVLGDTHGGAGQDCPDSGDYVGDSSWPQALQVTEEFEFCGKFGSEGTRTLEQELAAKAKLRIPVGRYALPATPGTRDFALPVCIERAPGMAPFAFAGAGQLLRVRSVRPLHAPLGAADHRAGSRHLEPRGRLRVRGRHGLGPGAADLRRQRRPGPDQPPDLDLRRGRMRALARRLVHGL